MSQADWAEMSGVVSDASIKRGVSAGFTPPNGGGAFIFGFNSVEVVEGAVALICTIADFSPIEPPNSVGGGSVRGCLKRASSGGPTGFSGFIFLGATGDDVNDEAYILGLENKNPHRIILRKGTILSGVPEAVVSPSKNYLRRSVATYDPDTWHQLRLDMIVNANDDVVLRASRSDLDSEVCTAPVWDPIVFDDGLGDYFVDDALGVNSESLPFNTGNIGYGYQTDSVARRVFVDQIEVHRQKA